MQMDIEEQKKWAKGLKEGDLILSCSFDSLHIHRIQHFYLYPLWVDKALEILGIFLWAQIILYLQRFVWYAIPKTRYVDSHIVFVDDSSCSAVHCCSIYEASHD